VGVRVDSHSAYSHSTVFFITDSFEKVVNSSQFGIMDRFILYPFSNVCFVLIAIDFVTNGSEVFKVGLQSLQELSPLDRFGRCFFFTRK